jgi:ribosomal protein S18 acetylase RimI-like enzyme
MIKITDFDESYIDECMKIEEENMIQYDGWKAGATQLEVWNGWHKPLPKRILVLEGKLIGFSVFRIINDCLEIINLHVGKEYQGNGYGKQLIEDLIGITKKNKVSKVRLTVFKNNPALKLEERLGLKIISDGKEPNSFSMEMVI